MEVILNLFFMDVTINYVAVLVAAVASMGLGAIWYGPLFGKHWMALSGMKKEDVDMSKGAMTKMYAAGFVIALVMAYVLAWWIGLSETRVSAFMTGFWLWLGFVATITYNSVLWGGRPKKLWLLDNGYYLLSLLMMSMILFYL